MALTISAFASRAQQYEVDIRSAEVPNLGAVLYQTNNPVRILIFQVYNGRRIPPRGRLALDIKATGCRPLKQSSEGIWIITPTDPEVVVTVSINKQPLTPVRFQVKPMPTVKRIQVLYQDAAGEWNACDDSWPLNASKLDLGIVMSDEQFARTHREEGRLWITSFMMKVHGREYIIKAGSANMNLYHVQRDDVMTLSDFRIMRPKYPGDYVEVPTVNIPAVRLVVK